MNTSRDQSTRVVSVGQRPIAASTLTVVCLTILLAQGCAHRAAKNFATPEEAVQALTTALRADDVGQLRKIVGSDGDEIVASGDAAADKIGRQKFLAAYDEKHTLVDQGTDAKTLVIGNSDWPFPVPVARGAKGWFFDCNAGKEEILNRRIGRNELSAIEVCRAIADAQREYALMDPDGNGVHEYAQQFPSDPGKRNGLYWPVAEGEPPSPLGEFVVQATAEGYRRKEEGPTPYHGYYYRILKEQGPNAPGGALDYLVKGKMTLGFAVVAYPAHYDNSGIMTFIMAADGVVYQQDLGEDSDKIARELKAFDPDPKWKKVE
jgi:hypothetical protein